MFWCYQTSGNPYVYRKIGEEDRKKQWQEKYKLAPNAPNSLYWISTIHYLYAWSVNVVYYTLSMILVFVIHKIGKSYKSYFPSVKIILIAYQFVKFIQNWIRMHLDFKINQSLYITNIHPPRNWQESEMKAIKCIIDYVLQNIFSFGKWSSFSLSGVFGCLVCNIKIDYSLGWIILCFEMQSWFYPIC